MYRKYADESKNYGGQSKVQKEGDVTESQTGVTRER